jgi:uncharacterized protein with von Willebrand factor type A (vWA) domain
VFIPFLYELRRRKVPVGLTEARALAQALTLGLHDSSLHGFYHTARALLVHSEAHLDAFDQAFSQCFGSGKGSPTLSEEVLAWLDSARSRKDQLTEEERAWLLALDTEELQELLRRRLGEQTQRHDGGNRFVGTEGTSPLGNAGAMGQPGLRLAGGGGRRSAQNAWDARAYERYRDDLVLDTRQLGVALRKLRALTREGSRDELDVDATIDATAKNAGELELKLRPPRRPGTRVILMMDVGGSMTPYAHLVSRLFSAARKATHFKELRTYYFHNCVYGRVYETERMEAPLEVPRLLRECAPHYKLVMVGDALMAPYELFSPWGFGFEGEAPTGQSWLTQLSSHFKRSAWLNPEPQSSWRGNTIEAIARVFPMFPLTLDGLGRAVSHLVRPFARSL